MVIDNPSHEQAYNRVKQGKRGAMQQAEGGIGKIQVALDGLDHQHQDLPIKK